MINYKADIQRYKERYKHYYNAIIPLKQTLTLLINIEHSLVDNDIEYIDSVNSKNIQKTIFSLSELYHQYKKDINKISKQIRLYKDNDKLADKALAIIQKNKGDKNVQ